MSLVKKSSEINGTGIFTDTFIRGGDVFYKVPLDSVASTPHPHWARIAPDKYANDEQVLNWVNHSCDPTAILDISTEAPTLVAARNIEKNQEISVDYNRTEVGGVRAPCHCGSKNCKGYFLRVE